MCNLNVCFYRPYARMHWAINAGKCVYMSVFALEVCVGTSQLWSDLLRDDDGLWKAVKRWCKMIKSLFVVFHVRAWHQFESLLSELVQQFGRRERIIWPDLVGEEKQTWKSLLTFHIILMLHMCKYDARSRIRNITFWSTGKSIIPPLCFLCSCCTNPISFLPFYFIGNPV